MEEIWKDIDGFEGLYQVSNFGNVMSLNYGNRGYAKKLTPKCNNSGRLWVELLKGGKRKCMLVHRLVALAFIPNPNNFPQINHKDENPKNNFAFNLEWCTHAYNLSYGTAQRRRAVSQCKVVIQLDKNGAFIKRHLTLMDACRDTGINFQNISQCCNNKRKTAGGYCWKFEEQQEIQRNQEFI